MLTLSGDKIEAVVEEQQGGLAFGRGQGSSVAGFALTDLIQVGVYLIFGGAAIDSVDLASIGDDTPCVVGEGPFIGQLPLLVVLHSDGVNLADIS